MNNYDYREAVKEDVKDYLKENLDADELIYMTDDTRESLYDDMFIADSVTGNASGSYTFNTAQAKEYVFDNTDLLKEACEEFGQMGILGEKFCEDEWEWMDVTIRCYLLSECLEEAIEELKEEVEEA